VTTIVSGCYPPLKVAPTLGLVMRKCGVNGIAPSPGGGLGIFRNVSTTHMGIHASRGSYWGHIGISPLFSVSEV
jgi:hypothetical protein